MVPKRLSEQTERPRRFRAVLFRMVPKPQAVHPLTIQCFRAVLFRMVPKLIYQNEYQ